MADDETVYGAEIEIVGGAGGGGAGGSGEGGGGEGGSGEGGGGAGGGGAGGGLGGGGREAKMPVLLPVQAESVSGSGVALANPFSMLVGTLAEPFRNS